MGVVVGGVGTPKNESAAECCPIAGSVRSFETVFLSADKAGSSSKGISSLTNSTSDSDSDTCSCAVSVEMRI